MNLLEIIGIHISLSELADLAIVGTFIVYLLILRSMNNQLRTMQDASVKQANLMQDQLRTMQDASVKQANLMQDQLGTMQKASEAQNILTVINLIQEENVRDARDLLIRKSNDLKRVVDMRDSEVEKAANIACGRYDIVGILAEREIVPLDLFIKYWGNSIKNCYEAAKPLIEDYRNPESTYYRDKEIWKCFEWLYQKVEENPLKPNSE